MNMHRYWTVIRGNWIPFLLGTLLTTVLTVNYAVQLPDEYKASGTYVVRPREVEGAEVVRALDTLNRSVEIGSTYAFIARSDVIEARARETLSGSTRGLSVSSRLVTGTNVIEISVTGEDPAAARDLAVAVGDETVAYIVDLRDAFELAPLDSARVPRNPVGPNRELTMVLGFILGLVVGSLMALVGHLVKEWRVRPPRTQEPDPFIGAYPEGYFNVRFSQEITRAERRGETVSVGLLKVEAESGTLKAVPPQGVLHQVVFVLQREMSDEDVLAYFGNGVFAIILPTFDRHRAEWQLKHWQRTIETEEFADANEVLLLRVTVDVGSYGHHNDGSIPELVAGAMLTDERTSAAPHAGRYPWSPPRSTEDDR